MTSSRRYKTRPERVQGRFRISSVAALALTLAGLTFFQRENPKDGKLLKVGKPGMVEQALDKERKWEQHPKLEISQDASDVETAAQRYVLYILLPLWFVPGVLDYWMHRRTDIEHTSGTRESLIHCLMMSEVGVPVMMALLLEINPLTLLLMLATPFIHEATAFWDVSTAVKSGREVRPNEQHIHSFLEVTSFVAASFITVLHWEQVQALLGQNNKKAEWRLRLKPRRLSKRYLASIIAAILAFIVVPYGDEVQRCLRAQKNR